MMTPISSQAQSDAGFTLVEVLISMFIFALISVGALIALSSTLDARERSQTRMSEVEALAAARRLLADDFAAMVDRQNRDGLGGIVDPLTQTFRSDRLEITRRGRPNPGGAFARGDLLRVSWRVESGQLIRAFLPHENPPLIEPARDRVVLDGVEEMEVEPLFHEGSTIPLRLRLQDLDAIALTLTHDDGTTTLHVFEVPDV